MADAGADNSQVASLKKKGKILKRCSSCGDQQPVAKRVCGSCQTSFPRVKKDIGKLKKMKKTNITRQRRLMEKRADILHLHHNCDVVIIMKNKHGNGDTLTVYGTEGNGVSFVGNKTDVKTSDGDEMVLKLFQKYLEDKKSAEEPASTNQSSTNQPSTNQPSTNQPSTNQPSTNQPFTNTESQKHMVVFMKEHIVLAAGYIQERDTIHGHKVPADHVCVLLTKATPGQKAPLVLGDPDENRFLGNGKFFALPKNNIYKARLTTNSSALELVPFLSSK